MATDVIARLACSLHRRDEVPNAELAEALAAKADARAVATLVAHLADPSTAIRND